MNQGIENMSAEQLRELVLEKQNEIVSLEQINRTQARESEDQIAWYKKAIEDFEKKVRIIEEEKESLLEKLQDILEKFSSIKFELSQLKRLVFGTKRERFCPTGRMAR